MVRTFVAANLTRELQRALADVQTVLRSSQADVSWVRQENLHLTLKFLGEVAEARLPKIAEAIREAAGTASPFEIALGGIGAFPSLRGPRVVWVGMEAGAEALTALQAEVEARLQPVGFPRERRPFSAHLTLGRVRSPRNLDRLAEAVARTPSRGLGSMDVARIELMRSQLSPQGSIYTVLETFPLTKTPP